MKERKRRMKGEKDEGEEEEDKGEEEDEGEEEEDKGEEEDEGEEEEDKGEEEEYFFKEAAVIILTVDITSKTTSQFPAISKKRRPTCELLR
jgi:ABC-type Zn2+ transport system substrate-binding protein/surface adhesin